MKLKKLKTLLLIVPSLLLVSCGDAHKTYSEFSEIGKSIATKFDATPSKSVFHSKFSGYFKTLWDATSNPVSRDGNVIDYGTSTVTINPSDHGTITSDISKGNEGDEVILTVVPEVNYDEAGEVTSEYALENLSVNGNMVRTTSTDNQYKFYLLPGENVVSATFELVPETNTVDISTNGHGTVVADKTEGNVNERIQLTITPDEGYKLACVRHNGERLTTTATSTSVSFYLEEGVNEIFAKFIGENEKEVRNEVVVDAPSYIDAYTEIEEGEVGDDCDVYVSLNEPGLVVEKVTANDVDITEERKFKLIEGENNVVVTIDTVRSSMFYIPTYINENNFDAVYTYINSRVALATNYSRSWTDVSEKDDGVQFTYYNANMLLLFSGIESSQISYRPNRFNRSSGRWNVEITYDSNGYLKSERAYVTRTYTSDIDDNGDIIAEYTYD